jgi:hypothetical protein
MARFWKFNAFVGTVGVVLLVWAFFVTSQHNYALDRASYVVSAAGVVDADRNALVMATVGAAFLAWQLLMTLLGLLVGFFGGSNRR